jgi:hypothetical protein
MNSPICVGHVLALLGTTMGPTGSEHNPWWLKNFASANKCFSCLTASSESTQNQWGRRSRSMIHGLWEFSDWLRVEFWILSSKRRRGVPKDGVIGVRWIWSLSWREKQGCIGWERHLERCSRPWVSSWSDHERSLRPQTPETMTAPSDKNKSTLVNGE